MRNVIMAVEKRKLVERLLANCEGLVSGKRQFEGKEWKLSQYVMALRKHVNELEKYRSVDQDAMVKFQHKVAVLEGVVGNPTTHRESTDPASDVGGEADVQTATVKKQSSMMSPEAQARAELFSQSIGSGRGLRHRGSPATGVADSSEVAMERQRRNQESIAEEMMGIARGLKNNALAAKDIIIRDNQELKKTNEKAEENITSIEHQTGRIKEHSRGCPWGTILILILVFVVFLVMVFIIRLVPKPRY